MTCRSQSRHTLRCRRSGRPSRYGVYTHVRSMLSLFGFATAEEKVVFERLISVSGIGPKLANTVLSGLATSNLIGAIRNSDVQQLIRIPGVGKKTAERIVLELKDKLPGMEGAERMAMAAGAEDRRTLERDVLSALQNLGCSTASAEEAIRKVRGRGVEESFEPFFRAALAMVR